VLILAYKRKKTGFDISKSKCVHLKEEERKGGDNLSLKKNLALIRIAGSIIL
jgi:hypothetical protein